jgi:hypothetical protein
MLIFTGIAKCGLQADGDGDLSRGVVRIRLHFPIRKSIRFVGSATFASLASIHGSDDEDSLFAVDAAQTIVGPSDGGTIPDNGLPADDLYVIIDAAHMGGSETLLQRIAYQASVLLKDLQPDLDSILVREAGSAVAFQPEAFISSASNFQWEFQVNLTGPVVDNVFLIPLQSSKPSIAPVAAATQLVTNQTSGAFFGGHIAPFGGFGETFTITATGRHVTKAAILHVGKPVG